MSSARSYCGAVGIARRIRNQEVTASEVVQTSLDRIEKLDSDINAFRTVFKEEAVEEARKADRLLRDGVVRGPLHGVPIAVKDNIDIENRATTRGLEPLQAVTAKNHSVAVQRLVDAGAIIVGQTFMPELGLGVTDSSWAEPTSTPFDVTKNAGGSSGGSAAAVAAGMVPLAIGTDGGGSIRIPASFCGVYGIKPSFRRVPRGPFAKLQSEIGPLSRSVEDSALGLRVMSGAHRDDPHALPLADSDFVTPPRKSIQDLKIAFSRDFDMFPVSEEVANECDEFFGLLLDRGIDIHETDLGIEHTHNDLMDIWMRGYTVSLAKTAEELKYKYDIDVFQEGEEIVCQQYREFAKQGREVPAFVEEHDQTVRLELFDSMTDLFREYDLLLAPTTAVPPVDNDPSRPITEGPSEIDGESVNPHLGWVLTYPVNLIGFPAASVPISLTAEGLPIGMQVIGPLRSENTILSASFSLEKILSWDSNYAEFDL